MIRKYAVIEIDYYTCVEGELPEIIKTGFCEEKLYRDVIDWLKAQSFKFSYKSKSYFKKEASVCWELNNKKYSTKRKVIKL